MMRRSSALRHEQFAKRRLSSAWPTAAKPSAVTLPLPPPSDGTLYTLAWDGSSATSSSIRWLRGGVWSSNSGATGAISCKFARGPQPSAMTRDTAGVAQQVLRSRLRPSTRTCKPARLPPCRLQVLSAWQLTGRKDTL